MNDSVLIAGIGSAHGDDQIGWIVARSIQERRGTMANVRILCSPLEILHRTESYSRLILIDGFLGHGNVGSLRRWVWPTEQIVSTQRGGTHSISVPDVLRMGSQLRLLPRDITIWGIEGRSFDPGDPVSPRLIDAAPQIAEHILAVEFDEAAANA
ncbi:MAG: hydrogenase maturation protease [Planctomycetaceae bacterium]